MPLQISVRIDFLFTAASRGFHYDSNEKSKEIIFTDNTTKRNETPRLPIHGIARVTLRYLKLWV